MAGKPIATPTADPAVVSKAFKDIELNRPGFCRHLGTMENGLTGGVHERQAVHG